MTAPLGPDHLLVLPVIMPSLNECHKMHWGKRDRLNKNVGWHIRVVMGREEIKHRDRSAQVAIRVFSNAPKAAGGRVRRLDDDNLVGGLKGLRDQLKHLGIIKNDSPAWAKFAYVECRDKVESPRTEIAITYNGKRAGKNLPPLLSEERKCGLLSAKGGLMMGTKKLAFSPARKGKLNAL